MQVASPRASCRPGAMSRIIGLQPSPAQPGSLFTGYAGLAVPSGHAVWQKHSQVMVDAIPATVNAPADFDELADTLLGIGSQFSPSEMHGAIVGALAGAMRLAGEQWSAFALAVCGADTESAQVRETAASFAALAEQELGQLVAPDLTFRLFLPDDEYDIEQRTECLADWCKGFLGGFAEARSRVAPAMPGENDGQLPETVIESLQDIASIAQACIERANAAEEESDVLDDSFGSDPLEIWEPPQRDVAGAQDAETLELLERDYTEVSEYLRLAALTVFTEYGWVEQAPVNDNDANAPTLH